MYENKEIRDRRKTIRLTQSELEKIMQKADELQMNFSEYIVYCSLNKNSSSKRQPLYKELITQIAKIGNNLNQLTKICNTEKSINKHIASCLVLTIAKLQEELSKISKRLNE